MYDAAYRATVCPNYAAREQASWDFLVCEANKGWSAAHVTLPFWTILFWGDFLFAWTTTAFFEGFEVFVLALFGNYIIFETADAELETLAGSLLGDWLLNGTLGVLAGWLLARVLRAPSLIPRGPHPRGPAPAHWCAWWAGVVLWAAFVGANVAITWVVPGDCIAVDAASCQPVGLLLATGLHAALALLVCTVHRSRAVWRGYPPAARAWLLALAIAFEVWVHVQNAQPWMPLWAGPLGGFVQVWLAALVWIVPLAGMLLARCARRCVPTCRHRFCCEPEARTRPKLYQ